MLLAKIFLPGALLLAKFSMKLFVDKNATLADIIAALLSLPVDIVFLAASFFAAKVIAGGVDVQGALAAFVFSIVGAILIVVSWRRSDSLFAKDKFIKMTIVASANYILSMAALLMSLGVMWGGV